VKLGHTLDTGALIALECGSKRMRDLLKNADEEGEIVTVPSVVITEWWRGGRTQRRQRDILDSVTVEHTPPRIYMLAGEALAAVAGSTAVDAIVMASAAQRGDLVYTSDIDDLERLRVHFSAVPRVMRM
jgi:predicted nucleic acid-binding protein